MMYSSVILLYFSSIVAIHYHREENCDHIGGN